MVDDSAFSQMKDGVVLVNVARGPIIDDEALIRAFKSGKGESESESPARRIFSGSIKGYQIRSETSDDVKMRRDGLG